jgi:hypothetical protein
LGVTKTQSSRWQKIGALDDGSFESRVAIAKKYAVSSVEATAAERNYGEAGRSAAELRREIAERGEREQSAGCQKLAAPC